ncbi:hypothetical protein RBG61_00460 [Paludicola sp. MB14-C6]|uniref:hypothetical protein n=1 Tax=Paludihabitans sp. MB14-C6 TaxID=3070656 RepID=UPI0027DD0663|nr:hypothetical protein [Paludicola sp. MB14-C6]WMJ23162.1 hypothetical protein RBG61_00460 [Paludicola sp. MB14-C6]
MKNVFSVLIVILISIFGITGCNTTTDYKFIQSNDKIAKIEIVIISDAGDHDGNLLSEVQPITDVKKELIEEDGKNLIEDLKIVDCYKIHNPPRYIITGLEAIKISYDNGDYELISYRAQASYQNGIYNRASRHGFDKDQFNKLLDKYLDEN